MNLHQECELDELSDPQYFALNSGYPIQAAQLYFWFRKKNQPDAARLARIALGRRILPKETPLPQIIVNKEPAIENITDMDIIPSDIHEYGKWGTYPYWHKEKSNHNLIAIAPDAPIRSLRYALASRSDTEVPLNILILSKQLSFLSILPPKSRHFEFIHKDQEGRLYSKTDSEVLRIDLKDDDLILPVLQLMAENPNKKIELSLAHEPCHSEIYPNTDCIAGTEQEETWYIDREPLHDERCDSDQICTATKGSWMYAVQQCRFRGKRLPTIDELSLYPDIIQWTQDQGSQPHHRRLSNGQSLPTYHTQSLPIRCVQKNRPNTLATTQYPIPSEEKQQEAIRYLQQEKLPPKEQQSFFDFFSGDLQLQHESQPWIENLQGGYLGLGDRTNLDHISAMNADWAIILAENAYTIFFFMMQKSVFEEANTRAEFWQLIQDKNQMNRIIKETDRKHKGQALTELWSQYHQQWMGILQKDLHQANAENWRKNDELYIQLRQKFLDKRIILLAGNLAGKKTLPSITRFIESFNIPIHMLYLQSIEDGGQNLKQTRTKENLLSLPFTNTTRVFSQQGDTCNIIDGYTFQRRLIEKQNSIWWDRIPTKKTIWITGRIPAAVD